MRTRFFEVAEYANSLPLVEKEELLDRWEAERDRALEPLIGLDMVEWVHRS